MVELLKVLANVLPLDIKDMWAGRLTEPMHTNKDRFGEEKTSTLR